MRYATRVSAPILVLLLAASATKITTTDVVPDPRLAAIHEHCVVADMHAHPSRFHRDNVETILPGEIDLYRK